MRLSQWRTSAPSREAMSARVLAVLDPVLASLGAGGDPDAWVAWGEEPSARYAVLAPTPAGLVVCNVRVNIPGEGPRAAARLVRWNRVQLGELGVETQGGRRLLGFQVEGVIMRGVDEEADRIAAFALALFAAVDNRPAPEPPSAPRRRTAAPRRGGDGTKKSASGSTAPAKSRGTSGRARSAGPG